MDNVESCLFAGRKFLYLLISYDSIFSEEFAFEILTLQSLEDW